MVYPFKHWLITFGGTLYDGTETFQFGLRAGIDPAAATNVDQSAQALANAIATPTNTMFRGASTCGLSNQAVLKTIKVAEILETGKYRPEHIPGLYTYTSTVAGGVTAQCAPQRALACSLTTEKPRGRAHIGRFYLPMPIATFDATGRFEGSAVEEWEGRIVPWLQAINAAAEVSTLYVMSKLDNGVANQVTGVAVGRTADTQRRRRRKLKEERTSRPI